jgi:hypothetical protein
MESYSIGDESCMRVGESRFAGRLPSTDYEIDGRQ